jgi:hypothetical protein
VNSSDLKGLGGTARFIALIKEIGKEDGKKYHGALV